MNAPNKAGVYIGRSSAVLDKIVKICVSGCRLSLVPPLSDQESGEDEFGGMHAPLGHWKGSGCVNVLFNLLSRFFPLSASSRLIKGLLSTVLLDPICKCDISILPITTGSLEMTGTDVRKILI